MTSMGPEQSQPNCITGEACGITELGGRAYQNTDFYLELQKSLTLRLSWCLIYKVSFWLTSRWLYWNKYVLLIDKCTGILSTTVLLTSSSGISVTNMNKLHATTTNTFFSGKHYLNRHFLYVWCYIFIDLWIEFCCLFTVPPYTFLYGTVNHTTNNTSFNSKPVKQMFYHAL